MKVALLVFVGMFPIFAGAGVLWQRDTLTLISEGSTYARIARLKSGGLICAYERGGQCRVKYSRDEGKSWQGEQVVTHFQHGNASNAEILVRKSGELWLLYNERPQDPAHPYAICYRTSGDEGKSWSPVRRVYSAGNTFENGCWEPFGLEYPDGEVQIFFANEGPYTESAEQQISLISSNDLKKTWAVSFRPQARDGMPVPCLLDDGETLVMAIEDSGVDGKMKPVILRSNIKSRWTEGVIPAQSPRRNRALAEPLATDVYAGAPYLIQMPNGVTVLSVQSDESREKPEMVVYLGDRKARNFSAKSSPFDCSSDVSGKWNSLFAKDENVITAVSCTTINGVQGVWSIDGVVKPSIGKSVR